MTIQSLHVVHMDLRSLRYFTAVAEELNIGRAAKRLHLSQPPLTRHMQQLEAELGAQLLIRSKKGVRLTEAGEQLAEGARNMLALAQQTRERVQRAAAGELGQLDVGIFGSAAHQIIPRLLQRFQARHPGVKLVLHTMGAEDQVEALLHGRLSVGFNRLVADRDEIASEVVRRERLMVVTPTHHPLARRRGIGVEDLAPYPFLLFLKSRPNFMQHVLNLCRAAGFEPRVAHVVEDATTGVAMVAAGFGICIVPESVRTLRIEGVEFHSMAGEVTPIDLNCLYLRGTQSPLLRAFLEVVTEEREAHEQLDETPLVSSGQRGRRKAG